MPESLDPDPSQPGLDPHLKDPCYVTALSHFYRGELGRIMIWRQRLDVTTTWAITTSTTIVGFAFSIRDVPHIIFFFNLMLAWIMLWIEARRYRFYDAFRGRVRMLESHFLVPMVAQSPKILDGQWRRLVCEDLILPSFKISRIEAVGRRMKRNYIFIFGIVMLAWTLKIFLHTPQPIRSFGDFYQAMAVQQLPAWLAFGFYLATILAIILLMALVLRTSSEEVNEFGNSNPSLWKI
jgi:uncharacterized membrane protein